MSEPYVGEVRLAAFNFAPTGWKFCDGLSLAISQYEALYSLIGTTYGGGGLFFYLPDLRGRIPIHQGWNGVSTYSIGQTGGVETVGLSLNQYPLHNHTLMGSGNSGDANSPAGNVVAGLNVYATSEPGTPMYPTMIGTSAGGTQPHDNRQPYQVLNWIIAIYGVFPQP